MVLGFLKHIRTCRRCGEIYYTKHKFGKRVCGYCQKRRGMKKGQKKDIDTIFISLIKRIDGK
jgi:ribosomal protein L37E